MFIKTTMYANVINASNEEIESYLHDLEQQLKGKIENPLLENFLSFQFQENPQKEFTAGYVNTFSIKGHRKSKNTDWQLKIPKSWYAKEGNGPNIIYKFISDCGNGNEIVILLVQDLNDFYDLNYIKEELGGEKDEFLKELLYNEETVKGMIPKKGKLLSLKRETIAFNEGIIFSYQYATESLGIKMQMQTLYFMLLIDDRIYHIQASVNSDNINEDLNLKMNKFKPLFMQIANSIIIHKKAEDIIYLNGTENRKFISVMIGEKPYHFLLDTGASSSLISKTIINDLLANGTISSQNFLGKSVGKVADGSIVNTEIWSIPSFKIGNREIKNITIGVIDKANVESLLGMDVLNKLDILKIDLMNDKIYLFNEH